MEQLRLQYLDLLKKNLLDMQRFKTKEYRPANGKKLGILVKPWLSLLKKWEKRELTVCETKTFNIEDRINGKDWPPYAETMIGWKRLSNVQECLIDVIKNRIAGDVIETGVWRGGTVIFMRAILMAYEITDKNVWVADSFEGLPRPNAEKYSADKDDVFYSFDELRVTMETVQENFRKYGLLDDQVKFLKGWFRDTLPVAPIDKLSLLRLDGDMYESTMDALVHLYPKLSAGGYLIIDDWGSVQGCRKAVEDYRREHAITDALVQVDNDAVYWKKSAVV